MGAHKTQTDAMNLPVLLYAVFDDLSATTLTDHACTLSYFSYIKLYKITLDFIFLNLKTASGKVSFS